MAAGATHGGGIIMDLLPLWSERPNRVSFRVALPPPSTRNAGFGVACGGHENASYHARNLQHSDTPIHVRPPITFDKDAHLFPERPAGCRADLIPASLLVFSLAFRRVQAAHLLTIPPPLGSERDRHLYHVSVATTTTYAAVAGCGGNDLPARWRADGWMDGWSAV